LGIGYYRDNLLTQKLLPYIFWISQGGFLSSDRTAPRRFEHATPSLSWSERYYFIPPILWPTYSPDLNPIDYIIAYVMYCRRKFPSRIANMDELSRFIDEWEHFDQPIVDADILPSGDVVSALVSI